MREYDLELLLSIMGAGKQRNIHFTHFETKSNKRQNQQLMKI